MDAPERAPVDAEESGRVRPRTSFNKARNLTSAAISTTGDAERLTKLQMERSNIQAGSSRPRPSSTLPVVQRKISPLVPSLASRTCTTNPDQG
jgi:hypothetical protein